MPWSTGGVWKVFACLTEKPVTLSLLGQSGQIEICPDGLKNFSIKSVLIFQDDFQFSEQFQNCPDLSSRNGFARFVWKVCAR